MVMNESMRGIKEDIVMHGMDALEGEKQIGDEECKLWG